MNILGQADPIMTEKWAARGQNIEQTVRKAVVQNGTAYEEDWDPVARACGKIPFRCLEIGTYCGYSALRIARNREYFSGRRWRIVMLPWTLRRHSLTSSMCPCYRALAVPENGTLLSVEKDPLFAAIATKIIEYAGLVSIEAGMQRGRERRGGSDYFIQFVAEARPDLSITFGRGCRMTR